MRRTWKLVECSTLDPLAKHPVALKAISQPLFQLCHVTLLTARPWSTAHTAVRQSGGTAPQHWSKSGNHRSH